MQHEETPTFFLPARRIDQERILEISREIAVSPAAVTLAILPLAVAIVNDTRQIVYANKQFVALTDDDTANQVLGKRLGEALGCLHACESEGGCGTTPFCRYCGAAKAIVKSLGGEHDTQECSINRGEATALDALNLQVWTAPMDQGERRLVMNSILDIAHEKALRGLERIFFHDIMNAISGIKGVHDLIAMELPAGHTQDLDLLRRAIEDIQDIVDAQKDFLAVETQDYQQQFTWLHPREILDYMAVYCQSFNPGKSRNLIIDPATTSRTFSSDVRIIQRILVNMIKNALEASQAGETITLGCNAGPVGGVTFWVQNTAVMPEETRMRLFQKGFSTKGAGRGFGTYSMRLFARECLGGDVGFDSTPENGTRFFLTLPV